MSDPEKPRVSPWSYAALALTPLFFSTNLVIGRLAIGTIEPTTLAFWRWLLAGLITLAIVARPLRAALPALARLAPILLLLGFLGMVVCGAGVYLALRHTTATNGTLVYTTSPAFIVLIEMLLGRRPLALRQFAGIALATLGVAVIVSKGDLAHLLANGFNPGDLGILAGAVAWAIYSVILRAPGLQALPDIVVFAAVTMFGVAALVPFWLLGASGAALFPQTARDWLTVAAVAVIPSFLAYLSYQWSVRQFGAATTGMALYFLPVSGVALAAVLLGEEVHLYHLAGTLLTIGGVVVATVGAARRTATRLPLSG